MYYQKLETLGQQDKYKKIYPILDTLDTWLYQLPKSYSNKILPEMFAKYEATSLKLIYSIFDELCTDKLLGEKFIVRCPRAECKHILFMTNNFNEMKKYIIKHNENEFECSSCDQHNYLTTDNVFFIYELLDSPKEEYRYGKKELADKFIENTVGSRNLSAAISDNPNKYKEHFQDEEFKEITSPEVNTLIDYILDDNLLS